MRTLKFLNSFKIRRFTKCFSEEKPDLKTSLIKNSLLYVNKLGWNEKPIINACLDMDLSSVSSRILSQGPYDLINYLLNDWRSKTLQEIKKSEKCESNEENLRFAIETRLKYQIPYINRWHEVMAIGLYPENLQNTLNNLWILVDDILFTLKDKSIEGEWYLKRSIILKIYLETEIFMLTDKSDNFSETWGFLKRRFEDKAWLDEKLGYGQNLVSAGLGGVLSIFSILKGYPNKNEVDMDEMKKKYEEYQKNNEENKKNQEKNTLKNQENVK